MTANLRSFTAIRTGPQIGSGPGTSSIGFASIAATSCGVALVSHDAQKVHSDALMMDSVVIATTTVSGTSNARFAAEPAL